MLRAKYALHNEPFAVLVADVLGPDQEHEKKLKFFMVVAALNEAGLPKA